MTRWVAGYKLDDNDLITFLKKTNWIKPDEEIDNDHIHRVFSSWALHEVWKTLKEGGFVPWPQWTRLPDKTCVTGLQTRIVAQDPIRGKACYEESDFDRESRDKFLAMTEGCFDKERMEFFCVPAREVRFPMHEAVPCA